MLSSPRAYPSVLAGPIRDARRAFQADHGLTVDGMVGAPETWPALISNQT